MDSSDWEKLVLERARAGLRPTSAQREGALSRLTVALSPPAAPQPFLTQGAANSLRRAPGKVARQFSQTALLTGVLSGLLLGFGAGYQVHSRVVNVPQHVTPRTRLVQSPTLEERGPEASSSASTAQVVTEPSIPPRSRRVEVRKPATPREPDAGTNAVVEPTFYEELSYVRRAQAALRNGDGTLALGLMRSLDQLQPRGALMAERNVTRVLALCQLGRSDEAIALTKSAVRNDTTTTIYQRRLSASCARDALSSEAE